MESYDIWIVVLLVVALGLKYGPTNPSAVSPCASTEAAATLLEGKSGPNAVKLRAFEEFQRWYIVMLSGPLTVS